MERCRLALLSELMALYDKHFLPKIELRRDSVVSFEEYPFCLPAVRSLTQMEFAPGVTFFAGENGSGKSTLLEAIATAYGFNPEGGSRNFRFHTRASHSDLYRHLRIYRGIERPRNGYFFRAESFFNVKTEIEKLDSEPEGGDLIADAYGGRALHEQSHGEAFMALLKNRFGGKGLYLLDEPEAALSPSRQLTVLVRMHELVQKGAQFVIATHSPILMAYPGAMIYAFTEEGIRQTPYEETEHYQVTRSFLMNPRRMLNLLLTEEDGQGTLF